MLVNPLKSLFKNKNFKLLFYGEAVSNLGDQFTFIGLAWLVTRLTGSPIAVGTVLALSGIPRAIFMLLGGAIIDRFSPRVVMYVSNIARLIIVSCLAVLILTGIIKLWMIYIIALLFGIADAFFIPARSTLIPHIVSVEKLGVGNSLMQGVTQLAQFIGPFLVGTLIGFIESSTHGYTGIGIVMVMDAITFIISLIALNFIRTEIIKESQPSHWFSMLKSGFSYLWSKHGLRYIILAATFINFLLVGPFLVGIPLIAKNELLGASSYGQIMSAWGVGALVGYCLAGFVIRPKRNVVIYLFSVASVVGICFSFLQYAHTTLQFVVASFFVAVGVGYILVSFFTLIQKSTPKELMGRTMAIIMFCSIGLNPVSEIITGHILQKYSTPLFLYSGVMIFIIAITALSIRSVRYYENISIST